MLEPDHSRPALVSGVGCSKSAAATERAMTQDPFLAFLARLCLVVIFPFSALSKIFDFQAAMTQAANGWIPLPPRFEVCCLLLAAFFKTSARISILTGFYRRQGR